MTIPASTSVGVHTLVATQYTAQGYMISGGPGRASIEVVPARAVSQSLAGVPQAAASSDAPPLTSQINVRTAAFTLSVILGLVALRLSVGGSRHGGRGAARLVA